MPEQQSEPRDKADLVARIERSWAAFEQAAWERSMVYLLRRRPRHEGLGVEGAMYLADDVDAINAVIQARTRDQALPAVLSRCPGDPSSAARGAGRPDRRGLRQPYSHFLPDEPGEETGEPILWRITGNTYEHFDQHRRWIKALVERAGSGRRAKQVT